jgi:RNA polymerase sigma-70 factor (ECF subfamily)
VSDAGDDFDALYVGCRDRLVMQVAAVCGDRVEAMDFVQEAFVRAWARWSRVGRYDDPEGWVRRVAVNLAISRWRRARRMVLQREVAVPPSPASPGQDAAIAALGRLPVNQRRAMVLHYLADLSVEDVAREMSAPVGTVKSWLSRGRAGLASALSGDEELSHD